MKKAIRIAGNILLGIIALLLLVWILIQLPPVQNFMANQAAKRISRTLGTKVTIQRLNFGLFNRLGMEGMHVMDRANDTLAYVGELKVNASDWFFTTDSVVLRYVHLEDVLVRMSRNDTVWNYQFIVDYLTRPSQKAVAKDTATSKPVKLSLQTASIERLRFIRADNWSGNITSAGVKELNMQANLADINRSWFDIDELELNGVEYRKVKVKGLWSEADSIAYRRRIDSLYALKKFPEQWNKGKLYLQINKTSLKDGVLELISKQSGPSAAGEFDARHILVTALNGQLRNLRLTDDTLRAQVELTARERSGLTIRHLETNFRMHPQLMEFANLDLALNNSRLGHYYAMRYRSLGEMSEFIDSVRIDAVFRNSTISVDDIAFFAPALQSINQRGIISGRAKGTISNFKVEDFNFSSGASAIRGDFLMRGLPEVRSTQIRFVTTGSKINLRDVEPWAPALRQLDRTPIAQFGTIDYRGTFAGTPFDFIADGKLSSNLGSLDAHLAMKIPPGGRLSYKADVSSARIDAGKLLSVPDLGWVNFSGDVGSRYSGKTSAIAFSGIVEKGLYRGYEYKDVGVNGEFSADGLRADIESNDENLMGDFTTSINFNERRERYKAQGAIGFADLQKLNLVKQPLQVSGTFYVDFKGNEIDDFLGYAHLYNASINDGKRKLDVDSFIAESAIDEEGVKLLTIKTDEADLTVQGNFNLSQLPSSFQQFFYQYYPSFVTAPKRKPVNQELTFSLSTKNVEPLLYFVDSTITGFANARIAGSLNSNTGQIIANMDVPYMAFGKVALTNTLLQAIGEDERMQMTGKIGIVAVGDSLSIPGAEISLRTVNDTTSLSLTTAAAGALGNAAINGKFYRKPNGLEIDFDESSFILNNRKWTLHSDGMFTINNGYLNAEGLVLSSEEQVISAYTRPSTDGNWNNLYLKLDSFDLANVLPFVLKEPKLEGIVSGTAVIENPVKRPIVNTDLIINQFHFNNDSIGTVTLKGLYQSTSGLVKATIDSKNPQYDFNGDVSLSLKDSAGISINTVINLRNERLSVLKPYLSAVFDDIDGIANGQLRLQGKLPSPQLTGNVNLSNAKMKVVFNKVEYTVDTATLNFNKGSIDFGTMTLYDSRRRKGTLNGVMYHNFFDDFRFNMSVHTDSMQVLGTKLVDNDLFYGDAVARADMLLYGPLSNLSIKITGATTDTSHIVIANKESKETASADYIVFKKYGRELEEVFDTNTTNYHLSLDLTPTPECAIDVVIDELSGDIIRASGSGNLKIETGTLEPTTMRGRYNVERGSYSYSFQTLIKRPFEFTPDANNYIEWNGDPYEAQLNVTAQYTARSVSLRDLMASEQGRTILDQNAQNYKGDVYVKAFLRGRLSSPDISFGIEFPPGSPMRNNVSALEMLRRIEQDNSEMLRQVTYLIVFRSFAPYKEGIGSRNPGADLAVNTLSDLLSSQMGKILTNLVQEVTGDRSLNVDVNTDFYSSANLVGGNVSTGGAYDRVNFNFMINKSYFNNRVILNLGSDFDVGVTSTTVSGFQFLPNVSIEFVLTRNRRLRAIIFKKDNLDLAGRLNRQGISFSYRKDYDKLFSSNRDEAFIFLRRDKE